MRLTIAIPCYDKVEPETAICLALAVRLLPDEPDIKLKTGAYVHWHREEMMIRAIEQGFSHQMMIDADLIFPVDGIQTLAKTMAALNADIVYGTYNKKNRSYTERLKNPGGFMLINLEAAKKVAVPRFQCEFGTGEDNYFFDKARLAGLKVMCEPTLKIDHIGKGVY